MTRSFWHDDRLAFLPRSSPGASGRSAHRSQQVFFSEKAHSSELFRSSPPAVVTTCLFSMGPPCSLFAQPSLRMKTASLLSSCLLLAGCATTSATRSLRLSPTPVLL